MRTVRYCGVIEKDSNCSVLNKCGVRALKINRKTGHLACSLLVARSDRGFSSQDNHASTSSLIFYRLDDLPDV